MAFRWDLLPPTKTTLQRDRAPTTADATAWYPVIWIYTSENLAWLLKDGTIQVLPPTSGNVTTGDTSSTSIADLESDITNIQAELENAVMSDPSGGQYQITEIALDANKKVVVTHNDTPEA
jgi:hypothetical protein